MKRQLGHFATLASLAMCLASFAVLGLHLGPLEDKFKSKFVRVDGTALWFGCVHGQRDETPPRYVAYGDLIVGRWLLLRSASDQWRVYGVKLWFLGGVTAVPPAIHYFRARRSRRRTQSGLCLCCGYDVRATPDRCPECGTPPTKPPAKPEHPRKSSAVTAPSAVGSIILFGVVLSLWIVSFGKPRGDHHGVQQVFVADGKLWVGPLSRGGEDAVVTQGWNIGVASWTRSEGFGGARWVSFHVNLLLLAALAGLPAAIRYRVLSRIGETLRIRKRGVTAASKRANSARPMIRPDGSRCLVTGRKWGRRN